MGDSNMFLEIKIIVYLAPKLTGALLAPFDVLG